MLKLIKIVAMFLGFYLLSALLSTVVPQVNHVLWSSGANGYSLTWGILVSAILALWLGMKKGK